MSISLRTAAVHSAIRHRSNRVNTANRARNTSSVDTFERVGTTRVSNQNSEAAAIDREVKIGVAAGVVGAIGMGALFFISPLAAAIMSVGLCVAMAAYAYFSNKS